MSWNPRKLLGLLALALLALGVGALASRSPRARFANLQVPEGSFPEVYLQRKVGSEEKCLVSGRAGTTIKRSEDSLAATRWDCRFVTGIDGGTSVIAIDKKRPSYLFVPFTAVEDLVYPRVYEAVREAAELELPSLRWVHFFQDRQFRGLHLEIRLPGRRFAEELARRQRGAESTDDGGEPERPRLELLTASGEEMVCFDWKMRPLCRVWSGVVADGIFPLPREGAAERFLRGLLPGSSSSFILSEAEREVLRPFPIPVSIDRLIPTGESPYRDQRYPRWQEEAEVDSEAADAAAEARYSETIYAAAVAAGEPAVTRFLEDLRASVAASCVVMGCDPEPHLERLEEAPARAWLARHGLG